MRTFLIAALAVTLAAAGLASPAAAATRNFGITSFEKIRVDGPYRVTLTTGVAPFARASGAAAAIDRVAIDMIGNTLVVHNDSSGWGGGYSGSSTGPVEISLGTHDLSAASLYGSGVLAIDRVRGLSFGLSVQGSGLAEIGRVDVDQLNVSIAGTASAKLAGAAAKLTVIIHGISSLDATNLMTKNATFGADGAATIGATVSNAVTVDALGPVTVRLAGRPACTLRVRGSASVSGCR